MRSIHVSMLALALTVLLCACVSRVPVWETVDDEIVCQMPRRPSTIVFAVPDGWASDVFSPGGLSRQYTAPDGSYEISATVFETSDHKDAIRQLTGLNADRFDLIRTTRFSLPEYQFAWSAETDDGDRLYRAARCLQQTLPLSPRLTRLSTTASSPQLPTTQVFSSSLSCSASLSRL